MYYVDINALKYFWNKVSKIINKRINDAVCTGLHSCHSCGAPYTGKPNCEYCGRGFFVDSSMYAIGEKDESNQMDVSK